MGVMIVDDSKFMRMMIANILSKSDIEILGEASNGREAIEMYKKVKPDVVTMDITMPDMSGIDAVKEIMKIDPKAKIIMCSAMGQEALVMESIKAGARSFIVKPMEPEKLINEVKSQLAAI